MRWCGYVTSARQTGHAAPPPLLHGWKRVPPLLRRCRAHHIQPPAARAWHVHLLHPAPSALPQCRPKRRIAPPPACLQVPERLMVLSNAREASTTTVNGQRVVQFEPTPPMSPDLLAIVAGNLRQYAGGLATGRRLQQRPGAAEYAFYSVPGLEWQLEMAAQVGGAGVGLPFPPVHAAASTRPLLRCRLRRGPRPSPRSKRLLCACPPMLPAAAAAALANRVPPCPAARLLARRWRPRPLTFSSATPTSASRWASLTLWRCPGSMEPWRCAGDLDLTLLT